MPTLPLSRMLPVPVGVRETFWLVPPAAKASAPVPVMDPVVVPVPPLPTARVPVTSLVRLMAAPLLAAVRRPCASTVRLARL